MKYDEESAEDLQFSAERHKDEGNKHFKLKKYRWATDCYSEGEYELVGSKSLILRLRCEVFVAN